MSSIHYVLVAREGVVLAESTSGVVIGGNASTVALALLQKGVPPGRASYNAEGHVLHVLKEEDGVTAVCVADEGLGSRLPHAFLTEVLAEARRAAGAAELSAAAAYALDARLAPLLAARLARHAADPARDALSRVRREAAELHAVTVDTVDRVLDRGERLELLVAKTEGLGGAAIAFKTDASRLRRREWWRAARARAATAGVAVAALYLVAAMLCEPSLRHC